MILISRPQLFSILLTGCTYLLSGPVAHAAGGVVTDPNGVALDRYVYYSGTEPLAEDDIRIIACGTGMPAAIRSQQASSFLVELGNGDKFLFDFGTGSMANCGSLMIPYDFLDKVFLSHLHTDHWGDFATLWAGGRPDPISAAIKAGRWDTSDVEKKMLDELRDLNDLHDVDWRKQGK